MSSADLRKEYTSLIEGLIALNAKVDQKLKLLEKNQKHDYGDFSATSVKQGWVELNIGGHVFASVEDTFLRWEGTYFHSLLCNGFWNPDVDRAYFIDRDPANFDRIMRALRTGNPVDFDGLSNKEVERLRAEVDYYQLDLVAPRWDATRCSPNLTITNDERTVTGATTDWGGCLLAAAPNTSSFKVRVSGNMVMLGYAKANAFRTDAINFKRSGWFIFCLDGCLSSGFSQCGRVYTNSIEQDSLVTVYFDKAWRTISFEVNYKHLGIAFSDIDCDDGPLLPCVELYSADSSVSLEL